MKQFREIIINMEEWQWNANVWVRENYKTRK